VDFHELLKRRKNRGKKNFNDWGGTGERRKNGSVGGRSETIP